MNDLPALEPLKECEVLSRICSHDILICVQKNANFGTDRNKLVVVIEDTKQ